MSTISRKNKKFANRKRNALTYNIYYSFFKNVMLNLFKWEGLPNNIPSRFIEKVLFNTGICGIAENKSVGIIACKISPIGNRNIYDEYNKYMFYTYDTTIPNFNVDRKDMVIIRNNINESSGHMLCEYMADKIYEIERGIDKNLFQLKRPIIVNVPEGQKLSIENLFHQIDENEEVIYGSKTLDKDIENIKVFPIQSEFYSDKLKDLEKTYMNEFLTMLGINNSNIDKRERVNTYEVNSNNEIIQINRNNFLNPRLEACEQINKMFNCNATVKYNTDVLNTIGVNKNDNVYYRGDKNGTLHNNY